MRTRDDKLIFQETEELCRLYMDCSLSVAEETELLYVLTKIEYHSPLIDDVRNLMGVELSISEKPFIKAESSSKKNFRKWKVYTNVAASISLLFCIGLYFFNIGSSENKSSQPYYIAYANGQRLSNEAAKIQIEEQRKAADDFIKEMSELEAQERLLIDSFLNP